MNTNTIHTSFDFDLPKQLECAEPTEERGLPRDGVRMLVSYRADDQLLHARFSDLPSFLREGDVLIVNTSGTFNAALPTQLPDGQAGRVHLSTPLENGAWLVEVRQITGNKSLRYKGLKAGQTLPLPQGGKIKIDSPFYRTPPDEDHLHLWKAELIISTSLEGYLNKNGQPIRYDKVHKKYPLSYYQTVFSTEKGSAEMPSAGRAFTADLVTQLVIKGVQIAPLLLHTGVSSPEVDEEPYPEFFRVPAFTASLVNQAKRDGRRIVAVGTTAIRAIESSLDDFGRVVPDEGMTDLFITPERGLKVVNAMLTGFHEPRASHLMMMEALASREHLGLCYREAVDRAYQWHEFGDLHLVL